MEGGCIQKRAAIALYVHVKYAWRGLERKGFENHAGIGMGLGHERHGELGTGRGLEGREKDSISMQTFRSVWNESSFVRRLISESDERTILSFLGEMIGNHIQK